MCDREDAVWFFDQPVSNSGRLAQRVRELSSEHGWPWSVEVEMNPDKILRASRQIVVTSDSNILDAPVQWVNLNATLVGRHCPQAWIVDLRD